MPSPVRAGKRPERTTISMQFRSFSNEDCDRGNFTGHHALDGQSLHRAILDHCAGTAACTELSLDIPSMLHHVFDHPQGGHYLPEYRQDVKIKEGVMRFAE
jgi:hypothetical protein